MKFKFSIKLAIISLIGNFIIAIGVSTCRISQMGIDPFTSMTTGISGLLNIPLGVFQGSIQHYPGDPAEEEILREAAGQNGNRF